MLRIKQTRLKCGTVRDPPAADLFPSWEKATRLRGARSSLSARGPSGAPPSHLCSDRMYVCGDYKLIVHGGPREEEEEEEKERERKKNHITWKALGLQATKCRRLYIQTPSSASVACKWVCGLKKKKRRKEKRKEIEKRQEREKGEEGLL